MKSKKLSAIIATTALTLIIAGCGNNPESIPANSSSTGDMSSVTSSEDEGHSEKAESELSSVYSETPEDSKPEETSSAAPVGEPTFFIGLDGKAILTSEITRLENTDKTAETITKEDLWADVYCDGFIYYKESTGIGFDMYNDPELFDGYKFLGETPENTCEWKRAYVGDEICGLKVKSASTHFCVNDWEEYKFPERYLYSDGCIAELEGTITAEGFLQVYNNSIQYPDSNELMWFYPIKAKLPLLPSSTYIDKEKGYERPFDVHTVFDHLDDLHFYSEHNQIGLGYLSDAVCDMKGIGAGDIAYVRATISFNGADDGTLEEIELLSDILAHDEDDTEFHQPAPVR